MPYERTLHLTDTDAAGVVYFANLLSICHEAYEASLGETGIDLKAFFQNSATAIPITWAEIRFFHPLFCGDRILIYLIPHPIDESEFELEYNICLGEKTVGSGKTRHVCIDPQLRQRIALPESLRQWLESFSNDPNVLKS